MRMRVNTKQYRSALVVGLLLASIAAGVDHPFIRGGGVQAAIGADASSNRNLKDDDVLVESRSKSGKCLTATKEGRPVKLSNCEGSKASQQWTIDKGGQWRPKSEPELCLSVDLKTIGCKADSEKQSWLLEEKLIRNKFSGLCVSAGDGSVTPGKCNKASTWKLVVPDEYDGDENDDEDDDNDNEKGNDGGKDKENGQDKDDGKDKDDEQDKDRSQKVYMLEGEGESCISAKSIKKDAKLEMGGCGNSKALWVMGDDKTLRPYDDQELCAEVSKIEEGQGLYLTKCRDSQIKKQLWKAKNKLICAALRKDLCLVHTSSGNLQLGDVGTITMKWKVQEVNVRR